MSNVTYFNCCRGRQLSGSDIVNNSCTSIHFLQSFKLRNYIFINFSINKLPAKLQIDLSSSFQSIKFLKATFGTVSQWRFCSQMFFLFFNCKFQLTIKLHSLPVIFRLCIASMVCNSTSAVSYVEQESAVKGIFSQSVQIHNPDHTHSLVSFISPHLLTSKYFSTFRGSTTASCDVQQLPSIQTATVKLSVCSSTF